MGYALLKEYLKKDKRKGHILSEEVYITLSVDAL
jgi:hypothetical protein